MDRIPGALVLLGLVIDATGTGHPQEDSSQAVAVQDMAELALDAPAEPRRSGRLSDRVRNQHESVPDLLSQGIGLRVIARQLGLARNTVRRLAYAATADELLIGTVDGPHEHP
jgi:DNA-binding NarL/FixJ family response regulator